jgi:predicted lipoprotein with Yx(FWY)xxD motif
MRTLTLFTALVVAALGIVACGGGSGGGYGASSVVAVATPTGAPTASPVPGTTTLGTMTLLNAPGFVTGPAPAGRTVYVLSDDTTTSPACTVANLCTTVWFPIAPPSGVALSTGFTTYTRPDDGSFVQLAYLGHPLYTYAGDSATGQTNGEGIVSFNGTWTVAHP